ncbi:Fc.00g105180.m01.CDS01 [Cosmosporella sp. VM-42]
MAVRIVEVGPRDGLQNIAAAVPTVTKLELIERLQQAGLQNIEITSVVSPNAIPQLADCQQILSSSLIQKGLHTLSTVRLPVLIPNLKGLEIALQYGVKEIAVFVSATEGFSKANINCTIEEGMQRARQVAAAALAKGILVRGYVSCIFADPYDGPTSPSSVLRVTKGLLDAGCYEVSIGDTLGVGTVAEVRGLVKYLKQHSVDLSRIAGHFHDTYGQALANVWEAYQCGIRAFDSSVGGLGGCPFAPGAKGNLATEDVVYMFEKSGIETGLDLKKLVDTGAWISRKLRKPNSSRAGSALSLKQSVTKAQLAHEKASPLAWTLVRETENVLFLRSGANAKIILNKPQNGNALTLPMISDIRKGFEYFTNENSISRIAIAAKGKFFCTGMNLSKSDSAVGNGGDASKATFEALTQLFQAIDNADKVTIACINGPAFGGGIGLAFVCDIRLCVSSSTFTLSEVKLGLCPAVISQYVIREWGVPLSREAMLMARPVSANELRSAGAISAVCGDVDKLESALESLLVTLRHSSPGGSRMSKELVRLGWAFAGQTEQKDAISKLFLKMMGPGSESAFGVREFQAKRKADWDLSAEPSRWTSYPARSRSVSSHLLPASPSSPRNLELQASQTSPLLNADNPPCLRIRTAKAVRNTCLQVTPKPCPRPGLPPARLHGSRRRHPVASGAFDRPALIAGNGRLNVLENGPDVSIAAGRFNTLPPDIVVQSLVDAYFLHAHNQPYAYFQEENFRQNLAYGILPKCLLFAVLACALRFADEEFFQGTRHEAMEAYAREAWLSVLTDHLTVENCPNLHVVQTANILAVIDFTAGRISSGWLKIGLAVRIAQDLQLMKEPSSLLPIVEQEEQRRTFWSVYLLDKLVSCGKGRPPAVSEEDCHVQLPCNEQMLRTGQWKETSTLQQLLNWNTDTSGSCGNFALAILVASVFGRCARYVLHGRETDEVLPWDSGSEFTAINSVLLLIEQRLQVDELNINEIIDGNKTADNEIDHASVGHLIFARVIFYLSHCLLNHPFLLRIRLQRLKAKAPPSFLSRAFATSGENARKLAGFLDQAERDGCHVGSSFYAYATCVAGSILSLVAHAEQERGRTPSPEVLEGSQQSFRILKHMSTFWDHASKMHQLLLSFDANGHVFARVLDPQAAVDIEPPLETALWSMVDYSELASASRTTDPAAITSFAVGTPSPSFLGFDMEVAAALDMFNAPANDVMYGTNTAVGAYSVNCL